MSHPYATYLSSASVFVALDVSGGNAFGRLGSAYSELCSFRWNPGANDRVNFSAFLKFVGKHNRSKVLIAGSTAKFSVLVVALLALGEGLDVFACADLIAGDDEEERILLLERLRQHGAIVTTSKQISAEFDALIAD